MFCKAMKGGKCGEGSVAIYKHLQKRCFIISRKMSITMNHFTNIMLILANNDSESKINFVMTHAICCLAWSKYKTENSVTKHHMP